MSLTGQNCLLLFTSPLCVSPHSHHQACGWLWSCCPATSIRSGRTFLTWWTDRLLWLARWAFQKLSCQVGWNATFLKLELEQLELGPVIEENVIVGVFNWKFCHISGSSYMNIQTYLENKWINAWTFGCLGLGLFKDWHFPKNVLLFPQRRCTKRHLCDSGSGGFWQRKQDQAQERGDDHVCLWWGWKETWGMAQEFQKLTLIIQNMKLYQGVFNVTHLIARLSYVLFALHDFWNRCVTVLSTLRDFLSSGRESWGLSRV